jgi:hypothetical protein
LKNKRVWREWNGSAKQTRLKRFANDNNRAEAEKRKLKKRRERRKRTATAKPGFGRFAKIKGIIGSGSLRVKRKGNPGEDIEKRRSGRKAAGEKRIRHLNTRLADTRAAE